MGIEDRLKRVHVVGVRAKKDSYHVVMSDPEFTPDGKAIANPDTWEVSWEAWVAAGADVTKL